MKAVIPAILAATVLGGCAVVPVAEQPVYVSPAPVVVGPAVVVRPYYRPYYRPHYYRHWR